MPNRTLLKPGMRIRLRRVPEADLRQRERELRNGVQDAGSTAGAVERIMNIDPVVTISKIDEYGTPWFDYELENAAGEVERHFIAIMDDESWELVS